MFLVLAAAFVLWILQFRMLLNPETFPLLDDALPYQDHVKYYLDQMAKGIYPLWDPIRDLGTVNEFYLRRIGEFNPLLWFSWMLHKMGLDFMLAYRLFLAGYLFLGAIGFWLICRRAIADQRGQMAAFLIFMFSSYAALPFFSYLHLILVPGIWFFYFLYSFAQVPQRRALFGAVFCAMLLNITYIPLYFYTALATAVCAFAVVYGRSLWPRLAGVLRFIGKERWFAALCVLCVGVSLIPGYLWYKQSSAAEMKVAYRNAGSEISNATGVNIDRINQGGIIAPLVLDRLFFDLNERRLADFFVPVFAFLVFACAAFIRIPRMMVFFFVWGGLIYLIGVADGGYLHRYLYQHTVFFKFFRNLQFFLWLVILPLLALGAGKLVEAYAASKPEGRGRWLRLAYVGLVHLAAAAFLYVQDLSTVIPSTYAAIIISFMFFVSLSVRQPVHHGLSACLLALAVLIQSMDVFDYAQLHAPAIHVKSNYTGDYMRQNLSLPPSSDPLQIANWRHQGRQVDQPFFSSAFYQTLFDSVKRDALVVALKPAFVAFDQVQPLPESVVDFQQMERQLSAFVNLAYVSPQDFASVQLNNPGPWPPMAHIPTFDSDEIKVLRTEPNQLIIRTRFPRDRFLVYNANYHSGWSVTRDGQSAKLFRANYAFQGVVVPAGEHTFHFQFGPWWRYFLAWTLTLWFAAAFLGLLWLYRPVRKY